MVIYTLLYLITTHSIYTVLNRALRVALKVDRYTNNNELYNRSRMLPLSYRRKYAGICNLKQLITNGDIELERNRITRQGDGILIKDKLFKKTQYNQSMYATGPRTWNNLDPAIRNIENKDKFKNLLSKFYYTKFAEDGYV